MHPKINLHILSLGFGMGIRSKRFAMILEDGLVKHLEIDDGMDEHFETKYEDCKQ